MKAYTKGERRKERRGRPDFVVNPHAECVIVEVDDPGHNPRYAAKGSNARKIKAAVNMMESPAAHWFHKDLIDEAQYRAAVRFRRLWETGGGAGAGAFDYAREPVDGGATPDPINVRQVDALRELRDVEGKLGPEGYCLVRDVCGSCIPLGQLFPARREQDRRSSQCREMLAILAEFWGYRQRDVRAA